MSLIRAGINVQRKEIISDRKKMSDKNNCRRRFSSSLKEFLSLKANYYPTNFNYWIKFANLFVVLDGILVILSKIFFSFYIIHHAPKRSFILKSVFLARACSDWATLPSVEEFFLFSYYYETKIMMNKSLNCRNNSSR